MRSLFFILVMASCFFNAINTEAQTSIFAYGSSWKYLDNGTNQGTAWIAPSFNDASWLPGNGQLGYGDGDEATVVGYGGNTSNRYITTYFRKTISITNPAAYSIFTSNVKRDDGIIVYINGTEVYRNNLATGSITYTTLATNASDDGATAQNFTIPATAFIAGNNTIAVEIHQTAVTSSDISFDMELMATPVVVNTSLVPYGSSWKYLDKGTNQGTAWRSTTFNDATWASGNAQLGYGDGDEATVVSYGSNASNKYITTYFRKTITVTDTSQFNGYTLNLKRDDGAVVYINGTEVFRSNMPAGTISYTTKASASASDDGGTPQVKTLLIGQVKRGANTIAVEVHQNVNTSTDLSFDLELKGNVTGVTTATLTRGPYLNLATQSSIIIRWKTNTATNSKVNFGTAAGSLIQSVTDNTSATDHIVKLTGLATNTQYFYSIGSTTQTLQGDANNYFKTAPATGSEQKIRVLTMGDMGNNSPKQLAVYNAYKTFNGNNYTDAWLLLGDNAYENGTDAEFQTNFFNVYQESITKNHVLWPATGNHDYANNATRQTDHAIAYYDIFTLPKVAEAGGVASGNEAYYSFNYGNVHFVSLDSYGKETGGTRLYDTTGAQATWLKQDLAANNLTWTVVYFHHPPYSKGSHNSDTDNELVQIRTKIVPILERYKVDLVICGHSHCYERSYLMNGHYGLENTFSAATHALSSSSAKYDGSTNSCPYTKSNSDARNGIVFVVAGTAGQNSDGTTSGYPHNAMYYSNATNGGSLYLEIEKNRLDAKWVCQDGLTRDNFTILKNVNKTTEISITPGGTATLTASWVGNYNWVTGATTQSISVSPTANTTYTVRDPNNCIVDTFNVIVSAGLTTNTRTYSTE
ncbi:MAG: metallophosphoesterase family protein [Ferruginibacter sp.]